ncbi:hypothetical protein FKR81_32400 [Lentzea tibetensis]|uniref:Uncharacterized protein n=1 Tax=Lentzea tibetensis TaxID=2591470 RepID=A0A563EK75_9PSEU|nr:hypothetical protein [Lentzea tibetensis]TWP47417.1 hypothetical protein FKR81_32400 [Lentzea tibetensis]
MRPGENEQDREPRGHNSGSIPSDTARSAPTPEEARELLYRRYFGTGALHRWREPGTEQGRARMDADVLRLLEMTSADLYCDGDAVAALLEIGDFQEWT